MFNEWWLTRNSGLNDDIIIIGYPTETTGIIKKRGCIMFSPTNKSYWTWNKSKTNKFHGGFYLVPKQCKKLFGHCPKKGELLCVKKTRSGWKAEKYDLEFSN